MHEQIAAHNPSIHFVQIGQAFGFQGISHNQIIWHGICGHGIAWLEPSATHPDEERRSKTWMSTGWHLDAAEVLDLTKMGSSSKLGGASGLRAISSISATFGPDDDPDDYQFHSSGADYFRYELPQVFVSDSAYMNNISQFIGAGMFDLELEGSQTDTSQLMSGMKSSTSPPSVSGSMTLTYEYAGTLEAVPDSGPSTMVCVAMIWALFVRRRLR